MMLKLYGVSYALNMEKILDFVFESQNEKNAELEVAQRYETNSNGEQELVTTEKREVKGKGNTAIDTIKYDLIKSFLDNLSQFPVHENNSENIMPLTVLNIIVFNTMINEGFLIEIKEY